MTLIIILLTLALQRYFDYGANWPRLGWFKPYLTWMQSALKGTPGWGNIWGNLLVMLPILLVVAIIQWLLTGVLWGALKFIFDFAILWYCMDAHHLKHRLMDYLSALSKSDTTQAQQLGQQFVAHDLSKNLSLDIVGFPRAITSEIFLEANERLFAVLFWFIILGPVGAIAYYLAVSMRNLSAVPDSEFIELQPAAMQLFGILDWIPVRVLGFSYALVGQFVSGFNYCRKSFLLGILRTQEFAVYSGFAALNIEHVDVVHADMEENEAALGLVDRAVFLWVVVVALFTLGGWL